MGETERKGPQVFGAVLAGALLMGCGVPGCRVRALTRLLMRFPWRFGKIQLVADCMEEGMLAYNDRDWRSLV